MKCFIPPTDSEFRFHDDIQKMAGDHMKWETSLPFNVAPPESLQPKVVNLCDWFIKNDPHLSEFCFPLHYNGEKGGQQLVVALKIAAMKME
mmetsp:Transcript_11966/g.19220  ORF Transcript_11966/g.19220 Transcript_11966/m.19220 type:complete len:91 (+) Transcript_11966:112-384(+)